MANNSILNKAKHTHNTDEWYTDYKTVNEELAHYTHHFAGKIVLCNCDDPYESAFTKYFLKHFNILNLKKLICTSYAGSRIVGTVDIFDNDSTQINNKSAYALEVKNISQGCNEPLSDIQVSRELKKKGNIKRLNGDGDFRSEECIEYLKEADLIVTNPPFSKFTQLFSLLVNGRSLLLIAKPLHPKTHS